MNAHTGDVAKQKIVDSIEPKPIEDITEQLYQIALESLDDSGEFTSEQRLAIAQAIQATMDWYIPSMAEAISETLQRFAKMLVEQKTPSIPE